MRIVLPDADFPNLSLVLGIEYQIKPQQNQSLGFKNQSNLRKSNDYHRKNKNTFNVPDLAKAAAKAAKRKTAEDDADAEFDALEEEIIQKQRKLHIEFPEYVKNPSVRTLGFEEEEQPTIFDLQIEMEDLKKLEADLRGKTSGGTFRSQRAH